MSFPLVLYCKMQEMQKRGKRLHLWITIPLLGPLHTQDGQVQCHAKTGMRAAKIICMAPIMFNLQDRNRSLWQVIPQRKVFNTCLKISLLTESKQTAGGHGMTKLQTLERCMWKRYEFYNNGIVMQCYSMFFFFVFWTLLVFRVHTKASIPNFQGDPTHNFSKVKYSTRRKNFHRERFRSRHSSFNPLWVD